MAAIVIPGIGAFIEVNDGEGRRHMIKTSSITMISDSDPMQNETHLVASGRTIPVNKPLDDLMREIREAQAEYQGY